MIQFNEINDLNTIKVLLTHDGDFYIIGEIAPYGRGWIFLPDYLYDTSLQDLKERVRREFSHL